jgi:hypothetical protein
LAAHSKKVRRCRENLVLIDESGLLMSPLVRRTWAPRGQTPRLFQRGRHREKVSVAAALWLPVEGPLRLSFRTIVDGYFDNLATASFLAQLLTETERPLTVLWDGGTMHRGEPIRELLNGHGSRLHLERLPPYAPMMNPVESLWSWLKYGQLCNFAPSDANELNTAVVKQLRHAVRNQQRLVSFWAASELPVTRTLLR